jgi:hypothetical protein
VLQRLPQLDQQVAARILVVHQDIDPLAAVKTTSDREDAGQDAWHLVKDLGLKAELKESGNGHGLFLRD